MLGKGKQKSQGRKPLGQFDTLISSKTSIAGDITFSGGLHIDGKVRGKVLAEENSSAVLRISEVGEITGDVMAPHVVINGTLNGDLYASEHLELAAKASINGNVYYNLLEMAMGAEVNGSLVHQKEPGQAQGLLSHSGASSRQRASDKEEEDAPGTATGLPS